MRPVKQHSAEWSPGSVYMSVFAWKEYIIKEYVKVISFSECVESHIKNEIALDIFVLRLNMWP